MSEPHVGSEIESYCMSCRDLRWHVIVALVDEKPVKVECLSCKKQHGYRLGPPGTAIATKATRAKSPSAKPRAKSAEPTFDLSALQARSADARAYAPAETYAAGDVLRHPTFGLGLVVALAGPQRIDARFDTGPRTLVHDRNGNAPSRLTPPTAAARIANVRGR